MLLVGEVEEHQATGRATEVQHEGREVVVLVWRLGLLFVVFTAALVLPVIEHGDGAQADAGPVWLGGGGPVQPVLAGRWGGAGRDLGGEDLELGQLTADLGGAQAGQQVRDQPEEEEGHHGVRVNATQYEQELFIADRKYFKMSVTGVFYIPWNNL